MTEHMALTMIEHQTHSRSWRGLWGRDQGRL